MLDAMYLNDTMLVREKYAQKEVDLEKKTAEEKAKTKLKIESDYLEASYLNKKISDEEYYLEKEEIELERADLEIENLEEREAAKALIRAKYDEEDTVRKDKKKEKEKADAMEVADAILSSVNQLGSALSGLWNAQRESELSNKKLTEKEKDKINQKYFEKEKRLAIVLAVINGAMAFIKALSSTSPPLNFILAALTAVVVGIQIATIAKSKYVPQAATGGSITGTSHQNGGVMVNAEGGEYIVNKRTMNNPQMAQAIRDMNMAGNIGYNKSNILTESRVAEIAASVVASIPVYVTEKDITQLQKKVEVREARFVQ